MPTAVVFFDPSAAPGSQFLSPAVRAEIGVVAPKTLDPDSVTGDKLADASVTSSKLAPGSVTSAAIGTGQVVAANIGDDQVTASKLSPGSVTGAAVGAGILTATDANGNDIALSTQRITQSAYAALTVVNPNVLYLVVAG